MRSAQRILGPALVVCWVLFAVSVVGRPEPGVFNPWLDAGLYNLSFGCAAAACFLRSRKGAADAGAYRAMGFGVALFLLGNVYGSLVIGDQDIYPSLADALWFSFYICVYVAIIRLVQVRVRQFRPSRWLDGAVGGLGVASLTVAFALGPVLANTSGRLSVVATNLAFPTASVLLIVLLLTAGHALRARDRSWWLLTAGLGVFTLADVVFLFQKAADTYAEGGPLDVSWPLGVLLIGFGALSEDAPTSATVDVADDFRFPGLFALLSIGLLVYGQNHDVPPLAVALAVAALALAGIRTTLTVREVKALAGSRTEARTDDLTGLPNRRMLLESLDRALAVPGAPVALMILDLDRFKEVNDSLGHGAGDILLRDIGQRLGRLLPEHGVFGRLGGDEFAILLPSALLPEAEAVAQAVGREMVEPFPIADVNVHAAFSIGIAVSPEHGSESELLLSHADIAMYRAKRQRCRFQTWRAAPGDPSRSRIEALAELRSAIDLGQLSVYYQPQLDLATGTVSGVEALVRWPHPTRGLVPPGDFLAMAEHCGLMPSLTHFVLTRALGDARALKDAGMPVRMSVNISASDLVGDALVEAVERGLRTHGLSSSDVVIEVTEDSVMTDREGAIGVLRRLRALGVHVSIDDFGTGHASLAYVRDLPLDELKLDRAFLRGIPGDVHNAAIVRSTIALAHSLSLPVVAEGVEDAETSAWLRVLGCDRIQGYYVCRAVPLEELARWLGRRPEPLRLQEPSQELGA